MDLALLQQSRRQLASIKLISGGAYYYAVSDSGKRFMCYCFNITSHKGAWKIYRRYREFTAIHKKLSTKVPLPRKGSLFFRSTRNHRKRVERRYDGLCSWLTTVFSLLKGPSGSTNVGRDSLSRQRALRLASDCTLLYDFLTTQTPAPRRADAAVASAVGPPIAEGADHEAAEFVAKVNTAEKQLLAARSEIMKMATSLAAWTAAPVLAMKRLADIQTTITSMEVPGVVRERGSTIQQADAATKHAVQQLEQAHAHLMRLLPIRQREMVTGIDRLCTGALPKLKECVTVWAEHASTYHTAARHWGGGRGAPPPWLQSQMQESQDVMKQSQRKAIKRLARVQVHGQQALRSAAEAMSQWQADTLRMYAPALARLGPATTAGDASADVSTHTLDSTPQQRGESSMPTPPTVASTPPPADPTAAAASPSPGASPDPMLSSMVSPSSAFGELSTPVRQQRPAAALLGMFSDLPPVPAVAPPPAPSRAANDGLAVGASATTTRNRDHDDGSGAGGGGGGGAAGGDGGIARQGSQRFNSRTVGPGDIKAALQGWESPPPAARGRARSHSGGGAGDRAPGTGGKLWAMLGLGDDDTSVDSPKPSSRASNDLQFSEDDDNDDLSDNSDDSFQDGAYKASPTTVAAALATPYAPAPPGQFCGGEHGAVGASAGAGAGAGPSARAASATRIASTAFHPELRTAPGCANPHLGLLFGAASSQGVRPAMEDATTCLPAAAGGRFGYFGVYDGHNGAECANFLEHHLARTVFGSNPSELELREALHSAFLSVDSIVLDGGITDGSGACAVVLVVAPTRLLFAHCGDSEAILCRKGTTTRLCRRHKPTDELERRRIEAAGGVVKSGRVFGMLAVSRAFGDLDLKTSRGRFTAKFTGDIVTAEPEILEIARSRYTPSTEEFIVLACDGLFEVMTPRAVTDFVQAALAAHGDVQQAADDLVREAVEVRKTTDNVSCVIVVLGPQGHSRHASTDTTMSALDG